jgi:hypothetical protein
MIDKNYDIGAHDKAKHLSQVWAMVTSPWCLRRLPYAQIVDNQRQVNTLSFAQFRNGESGVNAGNWEISWRP